MKTTLSSHGLFLLKYLDMLLFFQIWKHTVATLTLRLHTRRSTNRMVAEHQQLQSSFSVGRQCLRVLRVQRTITVLTA